jgi:L-lactate dehydrogenase complex protein LldG
MMSAREEILQAVRRAVANSPQEVPAPHRVPGRPAGADLLSRFVERVEDYRAVVTRCGTDDVPEAVVAALGDARSIIVPPGFPWLVPGSVTDRGQTSAELDEFAAVVTTATVAIAETGTVILTHGPGQGRRALSLIPDRHVCVVHADQVVSDVPEAFAKVDPILPQTWISGPSATSDIELNRVEGVHGPRTLHIILATTPDERQRTRRRRDVTGRRLQRSSLSMLELDFALNPLPATAY